MSVNMYFRLLHSFLFLTMRSSFDSFIIIFFFKKHVHHPENFSDLFITARYMVEFCSQKEFFYFSQSLGMFHGI